MIARLPHIAAAFIAAVSTLPSAVAASNPAPEIDFDRQIRPLLSDRCFQCHGPDAAARMADLRLDLPEAAFAVRPDGRAAIVPGDAGASLILKRIHSDDPDVVMPPPELGKPLTDSEIALIEQWINDGATWTEHWAFIPPSRPELPDAAGEVHPIDQFIERARQSRNLQGSDEADRATLIRRVTQDLTGLPPTIEDVDAFLADSSDNAFETVVDRLLASDAHAEHMARHWLDAARYGDTHGLHLDNDRSMWPYRDWVIDAFKSNMPFDQFTIEQLAGDLLPEPTLAQLIATGFNRNHVTTSEGGAINAEYIVKYASDRIETTSTVWMGLTVSCAACHDHKFDPISQREYYELFAYFNNTTEAAMDGNRRDPRPVVRVPSDEESQLLASITEEIASFEAQLAAPNPEVDAAEEQWTVDWNDRWSSGWSPLQATGAESSGGSTLEILDDHSVIATGENPGKDVYTITARIAGDDHHAIRLECLTDDRLPHTGPGRAENANFVLSEFEAEIHPVDDPGAARAIRFVAAAADHEQMNGPYLIAHAIDGVIDDTNGWAIEGFNRREPRVAVFVPDSPIGIDGDAELTVRLRFETHFNQHAIGRVRLSTTSSTEVATLFQPTRGATWSLAGPYIAEDGQNPFDHAYAPETGGDVEWTEQPTFTDGAVHTFGGENCATYLRRTIHVPADRTVTFGLGSDDAVKLWINGELVHANNTARPAALDQDSVTVELDAGSHEVLLKIINRSGGHGFAWRVQNEDRGTDFLKIASTLAQPRADWTDEEAGQVQRYFRTRHSDTMRVMYDAIAALSAQQDEINAGLAVTLVMNEREERRPTHVLARGEYDQPRDEVMPGVPSFLPPMPDDLPRNRLGFAQWLMGEQHPLTARVTVNRLWQQCFGTGLVETVEDFGVQGSRPTHPELLDWLALEFMDSGWDGRAMLRMLVLSDTYRQASDVTPELLAVDPNNRWLARGPRFRLDAEQIRDQALAASGLLNPTVGGPSVRPYQPAGLWKAVAYTDSNTNTFMKDEGDAQYRRSFYTYWKRTSPPPNLLAFDAPSRETCTVRRARTNTPLQALVLMNDPQFVEASRYLAQRTASIHGEDADDHERTRFIFRSILARVPSGEELDVLVDLYRAQLAYFTAQPDDAAALIAIGDSMMPDELNSTEVAALTCVASAVFALDEAVTRR